MVINDKVHIDHRFQKSLTEDQVQEQPAKHEASEDMRSEHNYLEDDDFEPALAAPECQRCRTVYERSGKVPKLFQSKPI